MRPRRRRRRHGRRRETGEPWTANVISMFAEAFRWSVEAARSVCQPPNYNGQPASLKAPQAPARGVTDGQFATGERGVGTVKRTRVADCFDACQVRHMSMSGRSAPDRRQAVPRDKGLTAWRRVSLECRLRRGKDNGNSESRAGPAESATTGSVGTAVLLTLCLFGPALGQQGAWSQTLATRQARRSYACQPGMLSP